jgi:hypothetical protein
VAAAAVAGRRVLPPDRQSRDNEARSTHLRRQGREVSVPQRSSSLSSILSISILNPLSILHQLLEQLLPSRRVACGQLQLEH